MFWKRVLGVLVLCVGVVVSVAVVQAAEGEEDKPTANVYIDVLSQYIWRGYALSADSAVIQPSFTASYKGFSINVWGNLDTAESIDPSNHARWNETDLTLSYSRTIWGDLSGTVGFIYYALETASNDQAEFYAGLSYALPWLTVGVTGYREFWNLPGWYMQVDLSRTWKLPCYDMTLDTGMSFGYMSYSFLDYSEWHAGQIFAALNIPVWKWITVSPRIGYSFALSGDAADNPVGGIKALSWDGEANHVFGGIRISAAF